MLKVPTAEVVPVVVGL